MSCVSDSFGFRFSEYEQQSNVWQPPTSTVRSSPTNTTLTQNNTNDNSSTNTEQKQSYTPISTHEHEQYIKLSDNPTLPIHFEKKKNVDGTKVDIQTDEADVTYGEDNVFDHSMDSLFHDNDDVLRTWLNAKLSYSANQDVTEQLHFDNKATQEQIERTITDIHKRYMQNKLFDRFFFVYNNRCVHVFQWKCNG